MDGELLSLKWNNHRTTFLQVIGTLRSKASYTDATIACDGKFYPVHKLVLSTCSEYFGAIFERTPCKSPVVVLKDIECKNLEFLLDYMYIGEVNVRQNELAALIKAAECLRIKGLAVPDEDPLNTYSTKSRTDSQRESSPPAKRRRNVRSNSAEKKQRESIVSASDNVGLERASSKDIDDTQIDEGITPIKLEPLDDSEVSNFLSNSNASVNERVSDEGGGGAESARDDSTSEMQEFFSGKVETEEQVLGEYTSTDFAGPSGVQNSNLPPWDSENSFPPDHLLATTSSSQLDSQQQQQQQQQLRNPEISSEDVDGEYSRSIKECYVLISEELPLLNKIKKEKTRPVKKRARKGQKHTRWTRKGKKSHILTNVSLLNSNQPILDNSLKVNIKYESNVNDVSDAAADEDPLSLSQPIKVSNTLISLNKVKKNTMKKTMKRKISKKKLKISLSKKRQNTSKLMKRKKSNEVNGLKIKNESVSSEISEDKSARTHFSCRQCNYSSVFKKCLLKHEFKAHPNTTTAEFRCSHCDFVADRKQGLTFHIKNNHLDKKPLACSLCHFRTATKGSLNAHVFYMHSKSGIEKQHCCTKCDYATNRMYNLNVHMQSKHTSKRPHACANCNCQFFLNSSLKKHQENAHDKTSGVCRVCERRTSKTKTSGDDVSISSIDTQLYKCNSCDFETEFSEALEEHKEIEHSKALKIKKVYSIKKERDYMLRENNDDSDDQRSNDYM